MDGDWQKAVHFDLSTAELRKRNLDKRAYTLIKQFMTNHGFEHTQYSGYRSLEPMSASKVVRLLCELEDRYPWFDECAQHVEYTDVGESYDGLEALRQYRAQNAHAKEARQPQPSLDAKIEQVTGQHQSREETARPSPDRSTPER